MEGRTIYLYKLSAIAKLTTALGLPLSANLPIKGAPIAPTA